MTSQEESWPRTGTGEYKVCAAKIEPVEDSAPEEVFPGAYAATGV